MEPIRSVRLLVTFLCIAASLRGSDAFRCYVCHSGMVDNGCGSLAGITLGAPGSVVTAADNCNSCTQYITTNSQGHPLNFTRACESAPHGNGTTCNAMNIIETNNTVIIATNNNTVGVPPRFLHHQSHCYCHEELCNRLPMYYSGSVDCYVCDSADYISNGCGPIVNPLSPFVRRSQRCVACQTTVTKSLPNTNGVLRYHRTCEYNIDSPIGCQGAGGSYPCTTRCTTNLCNGNGVAPLQSSIAALLVSSILLKMAAGIF